MAAPRALEAVDAEISILGAALMDSNSVDPVRAIVTPGDFTRAPHGIIFEAILGMRDRGIEIIDPVNLATELQRLGKLDAAGGVNYLLELASAVVTTVNIKHHAQIVCDAAKMRAGISTLKSVAESAENGAFDGVAGFLGAAQDAAFSLSLGNDTDGGTQPLNFVLDASMREVDAAVSNPRAVRGIPTGLVDFDLTTTGLRRGEMSILGGRPAMGKTSLGMQIAATSAEITGDASVIFSFEMPSIQIGTRYISSFGSVDGEGLRTGYLSADGGDPERIRNALERLSKIPLFINDRSTHTISSLRAELRRLQADKDTPRLGLVVIDYLQLISPPAGTKGRTREQEVTGISNGLRAIAKDFDVHVLALVQLNRGVEDRPDKRPVMRDIRESGGVEQDAAVIFFAYRDEVYNKDSESKGIAEVVFRKNRHGQLTTVKLKWTGKFTRFDNLSQRDDYR